jgi:hypothetical protein
MFVDIHDSSPLSGRRETYCGHHRSLRGRNVKSCESFGLQAFFPYVHIHNCHSPTLRHDPKVLPRPWPAERTAIVSAWPWEAMN